MNTENELVVNLLHTMSISTSPYKMGLATSVLNRLDIQGSNEPKHIYHAIWQACAANHNAELKNRDSWITAGGAPEAFKPAYYNIAYTGLVQDLQNRACWASRRLLNDRDMADAKEVSLDDYGVDHAMETEDDIPIDSSSIKSIKCDLDSIYDEFQTLSSKIVSNKDFQVGNVDALFYFAPQVRDDETGEWSVPRKARNFDDAFELMDEITRELKARPTEKVSLDYDDDAGRPVGTTQPAAATPEPVGEQVAPASSEPDFVDDAVPF
jgi:hypothetical protein